MITIEYDGTTISGATYCTEFVKHQTAPDRELEMRKLPNRSGELMLSNHYRSKRILLKGNLIGSSPSDLQTKVDTFKELFSKASGNLDITPDGGDERRYVATCLRHTFNQESYNVNYIPWEAEFIVPAGYGKSTTKTEVDKHAITSSPYSFYLTITGSRGCLPTITITKNSGTITKVKFQNVGNYIEIENDLAHPIIIDSEDMTVQANTTDLDYSGSIPDWYTGTNENYITLTITAGGAFNVDLDIDYYPLYL
jgi:phage-related protein